MITHSAARTAWRFAHAVLGLEDLKMSLTQTAVRDELTYTSNEDRARQSLRIHVYVGRPTLSAVRKSAHSKMI